MIDHENRAIRGEVRLAGYRPSEPRPLPPEHARQDGPERRHSPSSTRGPSCCPPDAGFTHITARLAARLVDAAAPRARAGRSPPGPGRRAPSAGRDSSTHASAPRSMQPQVARAAGRRARGGAAPGRSRPRPLRPHRHRDVRPAERGRGSARARRDAARPAGPGSATCEPRARGPTIATSRRTKSCSPSSTSWRRDPVEPQHEISRRRRQVRGTRGPVGHRDRTRSTSTTARSTRSGSSASATSGAIDGLLGTPYVRRGSWRTTCSGTRWPCSQEIDARRRTTPSARSTRTVASPPGRVDATREPGRQRLQNRWLRLLGPRRLDANCMTGPPYSCGLDQTACPQGVRYARPPHQRPGRFCAWTGGSSGSRTSTA